VVRLGERDITKKSLDKTKRFLAMEKAEKLVYIKKMRKREDALTFLDAVIFNSHEILKRGEESVKLAEILNQAEDAKRKIAAYGNPSLQLTNFVLQVE
jgi:hypothetical protein